MESNLKYFSENRCNCLRYSLINLLNTKYMIDKKLEKLKSLMTDLDQDKLKNSHKIDSISLIS